MKIIHILKISLLCVFTSLKLASMEPIKEEEPTKFIFDAIGYYEQGKFEEAAEIFKRYAGKPVPVAEPFCLDLVEKGYLGQFNPIPSNEEVEEKAQANMYFVAAQQFLNVKKKLEQKCKKKKQATLESNKLLLEACREVGLQKCANGSFLYIIGTVCEASTHCAYDDAKQYFRRALEKGDMRGVFGLKRVCKPDEFKQMALSNKLSLSAINGALSLMHILHQDEGTTFAKLSGYFPDSPGKSKFLLHTAALFGHPEAQFLWGEDHCQKNDSQRLYWAMQVAEHGNLVALNVCACMIEEGIGTEKNDEKSYGYYNRAAHHPQTGAAHFFNLALCYDEAKGTPKNYQLACEWYKKSYEACGTNEKLELRNIIVARYERILRLVDKYREALASLEGDQHLSDDDAYYYANALAWSTPGENNLTKAVDILSNLAAKGYLGAACDLVRLVVNDKIPCDDQSLAVYKSYLENAIKHPVFKNNIKNKDKEISTAYIALRDIYCEARRLFSEDVRVIHFSKKAFRLDPSNPTAKLAYAEDLNDLGLCYMFGRYGLTPDREKAERYLRGAIEKGEKRAKLPLMYLKASQEASAAKAEAAQLFQELLAEDPQFKPFINELMQQVQKALDEPEQEGSEKDANLFQETKEEKGVDESSQKEFKGDQINFELLMASSSSEEEYAEEEWKKYKGKEKNTTSSLSLQEELQHPSILSYQGKQEQAEIERLQKKYERMMRKVEALRTKKQAKYRKIQTLMSQHMHIFGGAVKGGKGSGRRIELGGVHSGFHQPHGSNGSEIKGGALNSLTNLMEEQNSKK